MQMHDPFGMLYALAASINVLAASKQLGSLARI